MKSRGESRASIDEKNLDAKIETERPSYTLGPCRDSAQHEGVVSLGPADAAPGTAVNRQVETVQDDHTRHLVKRSSDDCRTHKVADVRRQLKGKQQELATCEKSASKPLGTRPHQVSGARWGATPVPHMGQCRHGVHRSVRTLQEAHITRGDR